MMRVRKSGLSDEVRAGRVSGGSTLRGSGTLRFGFGIALVSFLFAPQLVIWASSPLVPLRQRILVGALRPGDRVREQFRVANLSLRPLTVLSVSGACGCVAGVVGDRQIPPFTTRAIQASFVAKGRSGPLRREILVEVDDPRRPFLALSLEGQLLAPSPAPPSSGSADGRHEARSHGESHG